MKSLLFVCALVSLLSACSAQNFAAIPGGPSVPGQATYVVPYTPGVSTDQAAQDAAARAASGHPAPSPNVQQYAPGVCFVVGAGGGGYNPSSTQGKCVKDYSQCDNLGARMEFTVADYPQFNCPGLSYCCQYLAGYSATMAAQNAAQAAQAQAAADARLRQGAALATQASAAAAQAAAVAAQVKVPCAAYVDGDYYDADWSVKGACAPNAAACASGVSVGSKWISDFNSACGVQGQAVCCTTQSALQAAATLRVAGWTQMVQQYPDDQGRKVALAKAQAALTAAGGPTAAAAAPAAVSASDAVAAGRTACQFVWDPYPLSAGYCAPDGSLCPTDAWAASDDCASFSSHAACCGNAPAAASSFLETEIDSAAKVPTRIHRLQRTTAAPKKTTKATPKAPATPKVAASRPTLKPVAKGKPVTAVESRVSLAARARKGDQQAINQLMRNGRAKPRLTKTKTNAGKATKPVAVVKKPAAVATTKRHPAVKKVRFTQRKGELQP